MPSLNLNLSEQLSRDLRESLCSKTNLPLTAEITPSWSSGWENISTIEKVVKIFRETIKSIVFCSLIIPLITLSIDLVQNLKSKKIFPIKPEEPPPPLSLWNKAKNLSLATLSCVIIPNLVLRILSRAFPFVGIGFETYMVVSIIGILQMDSLTKYLNENPKSERR